MTALPEPRAAEGTAPAARESLFDRFLRLRNRVLASARFQRWAAAFPLFRPIARRRASALFDLCAGFVYSQVLYAVVQLGLLRALEPGPRTASELGPALRLHTDAARRLLEAACALRLVQRASPAPGGETRYALGVHGAALLGNPGAVLMIEHHALLYKDLADPAALLRGESGPTALGAFWSYAGGAAPVPGPEAQVGPYSALMAGSLSLLAEDLLEAYPLDAHRRHLDVGGGEGAFVEAVAARAPALSIALFDLPPVAERARARLAKSGLGGRITVTGGDAFAGPLPAGADLISLVRVVHDHDDARVRSLLREVRRALAPGGTLLVAEPMADTGGAEAMGAAYFGFYLLAMGQGRPRTKEELSALLLEAGFSSVSERSTRRPLLTRLLVATIK